MRPGIENVGVWLKDVDISHAREFENFMWEQWDNSSTVQKMKGNKLCLPELKADSEYLVDEMMAIQIFGLSFFAAGVHRQRYQNGLKMREDFANPQRPAEKASDEFVARVDQWIEGEQEMYLIAHHFGQRIQDSLSESKMIISGLIPKET